MNIRRQFEGCKEDEISMSSDTTFNLMTNGFALYSCGCRGIYEVGEDLRQQYRPFMFLVAPTERGEGYAGMFGPCLNLALSWLDIPRHKYRCSVSCSDHHDGLIKAARETLMGKSEF
jgi:hypothetical protein